jgi:hypothetical protein
MSLPDEGGLAGKVEASSTSTVLFDGDLGQLSLETRRVLIQLLIGPAIDGRRQQKLWTALIRDEQVVRSRLSDLFLTLVIDPEVQVAFTRQADTEGREVPRLLRRAQLTFIDSLLLLYLRERLARAEAHGERAAVSESEMLEYLTPYERAANTDHAGFIKRAHAAIEKVKTNSILHKIRGSESRYEISPTLKLLFSVEQIKELTVLYQNLGTEHASEDPESEPAEGEA